MNLFHSFIVGISSWLLNLSLVLNPSPIQVVPIQPVVVPPVAIASTTTVQTPAKVVPVKTVSKEGTTVSPAVSPVVSPIIPVKTVSTPVVDAQVSVNPLVGQYTNFYTQVSSVVSENQYLGVTDNSTFDDVNVKPRALFLLNLKETLEKEMMVFKGVTMIPSSTYGQYNSLLLGHVADFNAEEHNFTVQETSTQNLQSYVNYSNDQDQISLLEQQILTLKEQYYAQVQQINSGGTPQVFINGKIDALKTNVNQQISELNLEIQQLQIKDGQTPQADIAGISN